MHPQDLGRVLPLYDAVDVEAHDGDAVDGVDDGSGWGRRRGENRGGVPARTKLGDELSHQVFDPADPRAVERRHEENAHVAVRRRVQPSSSVVAPNTRSRSSTGAAPSYI